MLEKMKMINERIGQLFDTGSGRADISGNEILIGAVGCKTHYVELLINMHMHVSKKKLVFSLNGLADYLHISVNQLKKKIKDSESNVDDLIVSIKRMINTGTISKTCEDVIYRDFYKEYIAMLKVNDKKQLLDNDDVFRIVRCAIIALEQNITKDVDIYNMLDVSQSSWNTKYCNVFHNAVFFIYGQLRIVANKVYKRCK